MSTKTCTRFASLDLMRIIAILMVCMIHLNHDKSTFHGHFAASVSAVAVNLYVVITGYIYTGIKWKISRLINLWFQVAVYTMGLFAIGVLTGRCDFPDLSMMIYPVPFANVYWFFNCYVVLFLAVPFMDKMVQHMSNKEFIALLMIFPVALSFVNCHYDYFSSGYNVPWFMALYLTGAYLRRYPINLSLKVSALLYCSATISFAVVGWYRHPFYMYSHPFVWLETVLLFIFLQRITIKGVFVSVVSFIAPLTFGIYLIHEHPAVSSLRELAFSNKSGWWVLYAKVLTVFSVCAVIDCCRLFLFRLLQIKILSGFLGRITESTTRYIVRFISKMST